MINLRKWDSLNKSQKELIETACLANTTHSISTSEVLQFETLKKIIIKGVDVRRFPDHIIVGIEKAWLKVANAQSKSNDDFRKVLKSLRKFRKNHSIWQELGKI
jgi:TRAP-type mannitol/chloroaromatic compound transport system substrate-binding protein